MSELSPGVPAWEAEVGPADGPEAPEDAATGGLTTAAEATGRGDATDDADGTTLGTADAVWPGLGVGMGDPDGCGVGRGVTLGVACGVVNGLGSIGSVVQVFATVYIADHYGWRVMFDVFTVIAAVSALPLLPFWRVRPQHA